MEQQTTPPQTSLPPIQDVDEIKNNLNLLGIFHQVLGVVSIVFGLIPIIHITVGIMILTGNLDETTTQPVSFPDFKYFIGGMFVGIGSLVFILAQALAILILTNGGRLKKQRRYTLSLVTAALECTMFPLGTVLGVFTLIVMTKPQAKAMFQSQGNRQS